MKTLKKLLGMLVIVCTSQSIMANEINDYVPAEYCQSKGKNAYYEYIDKIKVGEKEITTGLNFGYGSEFGRLLFLEAGKDITITLTPFFPRGSYLENWKVWIDLNGDGEFNETEELVFKGKSKGEITGSFFIPEEASSKITRMRVAMKWGGEPSPCEIFHYGEVEDYNVKIVNYCEKKGQYSELAFINHVVIGDHKIVTHDNGGYAFFPEEEIEIIAGEKTAIALYPILNSYAENWKIWIDLNGDKDFDDPGEEIFQGESKETLNGEIIIPENIEVESTRMRIGMAVKGYDLSSCGDDFFVGEVEDYQIKIKRKIILFDVDGNGKADGGTDGILLFRYAFFSDEYQQDVFIDNFITENVIANDGKRKDPLEIYNYLSLLKENDYLDIDCNGKVDGGTDAILIIRYLFNNRG